MRRLSLLALSLLAACEPPTPDVNVDLLIEPPLEVDTHPDICTQGAQKGEIEPFVPEEMCAQITVPQDDWYIESRQVELDFDDYCVTYLIQNENGELSDYCNGMQLHLSDGDEPAVVPLRAVAFTQKEEADEQFAVGFSDVTELQVKATLTLYSHNEWNNEQIETVLDYDILMYNINNCEGVQPISCGPQ